ncbi:hypothetical protein FKM82_014861, partial [Ascaphus truei]
VVTLTTPPATTVPAVSTFTLNFTLTNLQYTSNLGTPNSSEFNSTRVNLTSLLDTLMKSTSLGSSYAGCQIMGFSGANSGSDTKVDAICTYTNQSASPAFDRVAFFKELSNKTNSITKLDTFSMDPNSLFVNGYTEKAPTTPTPSVEPPIQVATRPQVESSPTEPVTLNFTITNLPFTTELVTSGSPKFNSTSAVVLALLDSAFKNSSISSKYTGCHIDSFRPGTSASQTNVNSICTIKKAATGPQFDRVTFYNGIREQTKNITQWGEYNLDQNSLYVNGKCRGRGCWSGVSINTHSNGDYSTLIMTELTTF